MAARFSIVVRFVSVETRERNGHPGNAELQCLSTKKEKNKNKNQTSQKSLEAKLISTFNHNKPASTPNQTHLRSVIIHLPDLCSKVLEPPHERAVAVAAQHLMGRLRGPPERLPQLLNLRPLVLDLDRVLPGSLLQAHVLLADVLTGGGGEGG